MSPGLPGPSSVTPIWEEPVRGFYTDPGDFVARSGLEVFRGTLESGLGPPIRYLFGLVPASIEPDRVTFTMPVTDWLLFPQGVVSGATLGILVDAPLGCAVQTALPPATPFTTAEISFKFLRTVVPQSGTLTAQGRLIHVGRTTGVSLVEVTDQAGRMIAITSTRCAIFPRLEVPAELIEQALNSPPRGPEPDWPSPHPYQRPPVGQVLPQDVWDHTDGLGVLRSLIAGDLPAPPIRYFCGIAPVAAEAGRTTWKMPASEWLCAPVQGRLYGGAIAMLAGTAIDGTAQTTIPAGTALAPVDLKVYFLRPVAPDGRDLLASGTVIHRGRSIVIGTSEVFDGDGKKVAVATGSAVILPGRPVTVTTELTIPQLDESEGDPPGGSAGSGG
jgi:uncharacterized protein (TIGR00369 family)